jgi:hypothetical protein
MPDLDPGLLGLDLQMLDLDPEMLNTNPENASYIFLLVPPTAGF